LRLLNTDRGLSKNASGLTKLNEYQFSGTNLEPDIPLHFLLIAQKKTKQKKRAPTSKPLASECTLNSYYWPMVTLMLDPNRTFYL